MATPKPKKKNPHAVRLSRLRMLKMTPDERAAVARKGGQARAKALTPERRQEIGKMGGRPKKKTPSKRRSK